MLSKPIYDDFEKLVIEIKGSDPGERMKRIGVEYDESGYILLTSKGKDLAN